MGVHIGLWRVDGAAPRRVEPVRMAMTERLARIIETDPGMLGVDLMIIGRQVRTAYDGRIDLLAVDVEGGVHVLELKGDRTPREVVAQALDYGAWVQGLTNDELREIYRAHRDESETREFDEAFATHFGTESAPETLNTSHTLTIVAAEMDDATERMVTYLATGFDVPINVMFFDYYEDEGRSYLARTWMIDRNTAVAASSTASSARKQPPWNGIDWYVSFGDDAVTRAWDDARKYGFVSAGGGKWYSRSLQQVPVGGRVLVHIPKVGYVGLGEVVGAAQPADDAMLNGDGNPFRKLRLKGEYNHTAANPVAGEDYREWVLPIRWVKTVGRDQALWKPGLFANQNSACKLRSQFTIDEVTRFFEANGQ
ncbi:hypothetical protein [Nocardia arthritidis]|uniref:DUF91 domain-containing protein n=1 Tax=Nocardia arthritidis TaxID=228602 RepID=A0A6G9Y8R3_9NOCA|nr:hypothetical protein [Nocardia arthritidis]QIS09510.1 hypothetical protein F5544_08040 [Nocardia arthritidis]